MCWTPLWLAHVQCLLRNLALLPDKRHPKANPETGFLKIATQQTSALQEIPLNEQVKVTFSRAQMYARDPAPRPWQ